jgi:hypothetical protein
MFDFSEQGKTWIAWPGLGSMQRQVGFQFFVAIYAGDPVDDVADSSFQEGDYVLCWRVKVAVVLLGKGFIFYFWYILLPLGMSSS